MYLVMKDSYKPEWVCVIDGSLAWTQERARATEFRTLEAAWPYLQKDNLLINLDKGFN